MPVRALILDRDGTLIKHAPYLHSPGEVSLIQDVRETLQRFLAADVHLFLHTNQSGVGRGMFGLEAVHACNQRLIQLLDLGRDPFSRICIAPEAPDVPSKYRKPSPRFAKEVMSDFTLNPEEVCYIGDRGTDLATAAAAGTVAIGLTTGLGDIRAELAQLNMTSRYPVCDSFRQAANLLLRPSPR